MYVPYLQANTDQHQLSRMVTTIDINNGFREYLLPLALSPYNPTSAGLRNAMLAVAAFHVHGPEGARPFKTRAIQSLSSSLAVDSAGIRETQLATSMMLCVYNVRNSLPCCWYNN